MSLEQPREAKEEMTTGAIANPAGQPAPQTGKIEAFLGKGSKVVGTLTFSGPVELDGYIEGEVHAQDRLTIGESAVINGRIVGVEVMVKGSVTGDIVASKRLSLKKPAKIIGNVTSANLSIEEGVIFEGKCSMGAATGDQKNTGGDRDKNQNTQKTDKP